MSVRSPRRRRLLFGLQTTNQARHRDSATMGWSYPEADTVDEGVVTSGTFGTSGRRSQRRPARHPSSIIRLNGGRCPEGWHGFFDVSYSQTDRNELVFETYGARVHSRTVRHAGFETGSEGTSSPGPCSIFRPKPHLRHRSEGWAAILSRRRDQAGLLQQPHSR